VVRDEGGRSPTVVMDHGGVAIPKEPGVAKSSATAGRGSAGDFVKTDTRTNGASP
jgi:hypothetical protein